MGYYLTSTEELQGIIRQTVEELLNAKLSPPASEKSKQNSDDFLSIKEASEFLKLAVTTIYSLTSKRLIPYYKKGKKLFFRKDDLLKWMNSGRCKDQSEISGLASDYVQSNKRKA
jgi:excisionase family DNA binding protein